MYFGIISAFWNFGTLSVFCIFVLKFERLSIQATDGTRARALATTADAESAAWNRPEEAAEWQLRLPDADFPAGSAQERRLGDAEPGGQLRW